MPRLQLVAHVLLLAAALLPGCADEAARSGEPRCAAGGCVACASDTDCAPGDICQDGTCVPGRDCGVGEVPTESGCARVRGGCERNSDCPQGTLCERETRRCVSGERRCATTRDCFADEVCVEGRCTSDPLPDAETVDAGLARDALTEDAGPVDATPADVAAPDLDAADPVDVAFDAEPVNDAGPADAQPLDRGAPDARPLADAQPPDLGPPDAAADAFVPRGPAERGAYTYQRMQIGGLDEVARVAFHPGGAWFVAAERRDGVHVVDWATGAAERFDLSFPGGHVYWHDLEFAPDGRFALLTGRHVTDDATTGVVYRLDAAPDAAPVRLEEVAPAGETVSAVAWAHGVPGEDGRVERHGLPLLLTKRRNQGAGYVATLREFDPELGELTDFVDARASSAGCDDLAFADNEFGEPGVLVVCGENGADVLYYTWLAGEPEWRDNPGNVNLGNTSSVAAHPSGDYALIVGWSGRKLYRFEQGLLADTADAPWFRFRGIYRVAFAPDGRRALVVGRAGLNPLTGTVIEFRHDLYRCPNVWDDCALTDVSVPGYDAPPYNADRNFYLNDVAFHPVCDGGVVGGGHSDFAGSVGHLIRFRIDNGDAPCELP